MVVSELAKERGKNNSRGKHALLAGIVMATLLGSALFPADMVYAADGAAHYVNVAVNTGKTIEARKYPGETIEESAIDPDVNYDLSANPTINAISIGAETSAGANGAVAMGFKTIAKGEYATALGTGSAAYSKGDLALGWKAYTDWNQPNKIAIGTESTALKENGISIGTKSKTWYDNAIAIGNEAETGNKGGVTSNDSIAIGNKAKIQGQKNVAIGSKVTVGTGSTSSGSSYVVAIGSDSHAYDTDSVVIGGHSEVRENAVVVGNRSKAGMQSVAVGSDIKAGEWSVAIGLSSKAKNHAIAMGYSSEASAVDSVAFGNNASAKGLGAIAIGGNYDRPNEGAQAYSGDTIAIGRGSVAGNEEDTATVYNSVAVGREARAYGKNSIALGGTANVGDIWQKQLADGGTAIGSSANAALENATAIGYHSIAYAKDAVTIGANTRADIDGGVALGSDSNVGSYSSSSYGKAGKVGYDPLGAGADETSTWKATKAAVSVGNQQKDITRQIINVAAGTDNTDAVNVAQLKTLGRKAWKDLAEAKDQLGARIATNTGNITKLSTRVGTNERDIVGLKRDVDTNDTRIRYLYDNMPFRHFISVNEKNTNKTSPNYKNNGAKNVGSIAIGVNTAAYGDDAVALGGNSFVRGQGSVIVGESSDNYTGGLDAKEGQFDQSIILGSNNTIFAQSAENGGREDKIIGNMNRVEESHGTFVRGTGNMVYDAYNDEALTDDDKQKEQDFLDPIDGGDPIGLFQKGRSHVTVEGDGNMVAGSLYTQVSGVGNEVSNSQPDENGPSTPRVTYNIVTGNRNTVVDSSHNLIIGDNHELEKVNGNIIIGSLQTKAKTEASNVTILGNDANVSVEGGVALGTGSVASTAAGVFGYDPATDKASTTDNATWKSGNGAVSVGTQDKTRQIINLAAGTADTDAVNVAQLKNSKTAVEAGDYVTVTKKAEDGKGTTYTVKGPKLTSVDTNLTVTDEEETVAGTTDKKKVGYKLELSKTLTGLESVSSKVFKAGDNVTLGETGLTITGGPSVTTTGIDANNTIITNVAAGAADTDAVNFGQLKDVKSIATTNEGNITKLKAGFIVKDGGKGKADVTLGGDTKQEVTFKAAVDKTTQATADTKSLSSSVDADRNVTYTLNMSQLKKDLGITEGTDGVMSSWKLKATGGDTTPQEIKNGEAVTFDVAAADKGLTVTRDGKTIKYGIEGSKIDLDGNTSITNLSNEIEKSKIHYFSVKSDDSANPAGTNWKNDGASGENAIAIGKDAKAKTKASVVVGLNASSGGAANDGVAVGSSASVTGFSGVAIGRKSSAQGQETVAIGTGAKGVLNGTIAIGGYANADGVGAVSIGRSSSSKRLGVSVGAKSVSEELGVSVGTQSFSKFRSVAVGEEANAESKYSVAVGDQTASYAEAGVTLGNKTRVYGDSSVAIGNEARVSGKPLTEAEYNALPDAEKSSYKVQEARYPDPDNPAHKIIEKTYFKVFNAADWNAETHYNSIAIGTTSFVEAKEAIGIGAATWIHGDRGVALGHKATSGENGTALGAGARANANAGVALGEGAVADTAAEVAGYDPKTGKASTETTPTWKSVKGAVSVGTADATRQITNLAAGLADTDAVNVAQLKKVGEVIGKGLKFKGDDAGVVTKQLGDQLDIKGGATGTLSADNIGVVSDASGALNVKLAENINLGANGSVQTGETKIDNTGLTVGGKTYVSAAGLNANNQKITNVKAGEVDSDGVNVKQLNDAIAGAAAKATTVKAKDTNVTVTKGTNVAGGFEYTVGLGDKVTLGTAGNQVVVDGTKGKISVGNNVTIDGTTGDVQAGTVKVTGAGTVNSLTNRTWDIDNPSIVNGQAATEDQLKVVSDGVKTNKTDITTINTTIDKGLNFKGDKGTVLNKKLGQQLDIKGGAKGNLSANNIGVVSDASGALNVKLAENINLGANGSVQAGATKIDNTGLTVGGKTYVSAAGLNANNQQITNVADGVANTDAVNVSQLKNAIAGATAKATTVKAGANVTVTKGTNAAGGFEYTVGLGDKVTLGTAGNQVVVDGTKGKISVGNNVTIDGTTGDVQAGTVKVTGAGTVNSLTNRTWDIDNPSIVNGQAATEDQLKVVSDGVKTNKTDITTINTTIDKGLNFKGDKGTVLNKKLGQQLDIKGGATGNLSANNIGVVSDGSALNIKLAENINLGANGSVQTGVTKIDNTGLTVDGKTYVSAAGLNANDKKITHVAAGEADSDAATVGQLKDLAGAAGNGLNELGNQIGRLDGRVNKVGAGAAALAALHPVDFDADDKLDVAAGWGHYKGRNAMALGAFYRPDERTMFSLGGTVGNGENMINAGITFKLDKRRGPIHAITSKVQLVQEVTQLKADNDELRKDNAELREQMKEINAKLEKLMAAK